MSRDDTPKPAMLSSRGHPAVPDLIRTLPAQFPCFYREMAEKNMTGKGISPSNGCSALLQKERK
jgi:hypothetical protein